MPEAQKSQGESRRGKTRSESPVGDAQTAIAELEGKLQELEERMREQRMRRTELLQELETAREQAQSGDPDAAEAVASLQAGLRRLDLEHRQSRTEYAEWLREIEVEQRRIMRGRVAQARGAFHVRVGDSATDPLQTTARDYVDASASYSTPAYTETLSRALNQSTRVGNAIFLSHLDMLGAAADAIGAFTNEVYARNAARRGQPGYSGVPDVYGDVMAGVMRAADQSAGAPARAAGTLSDSFR